MSPQTIAVVFNNFNFKPHKIMYFNDIGAEMKSIIEIVLNYSFPMSISIIFSINQYIGHGSVNK